MIGALASVAELLLSQACDFHIFTVPTGYHPPSLAGSWAATAYASWIDSGSPCRGLKKSLAFPSPTQPGRKASQMTLQIPTQAGPLLSLAMPPSPVPTVIPHWCTENPPLASSSWRQSSFSCINVQAANTCMLLLSGTNVAKGASAMT